MLNSIDVVEDTLSGDVSLGSPLVIVDISVALQRLPDTFRWPSSSLLTYREMSL